MARAVCVALAFAALASGARYVDYSGVKMPEYGGGIDYEGPRDSPSASVDDYHDHSQDAPANLDYKYEEDAGKIEKPHVKEVDEPEEWQKPDKKQRKDDDGLEIEDKYSSDEVVPKFKSNHRFVKHRPRLKDRNLANLDNIKRNRPTRHGRYRKNDRSEVERNIDDFPEDEGKINYNRRSTTMRKARRKPRERFMLPGTDIEDEVVDDELLRKRIESPDFLPENFRDRPLPRRPAQQFPPLPRLGGAPRGDIDLDVPLDNLSRMRGKDIQKQKKYEDYSDYYDMKRVQGIKDKLPVLLRRTSTTTTVMMATVPSLRGPGDVWPNRRMMAPIPYGDYSPEGESDSADNFTPIITSTAAPKTISTTTRTLVITSRFANSTIIRSHTTPDLPKSTVTLSLAEKSRLSILKKAQRKEMLKGEVTLKPPVLMQVTNHIQTLVIVEPPTSELPWQRAREVHDDSPDHLKQVKRLMRNKIVSNAKNIHDLTENWDDMVCDYIDVALLRKHATITATNVFIIQFCSGFIIILQILL